MCILPLVGAWAEEVHKDMNGVACCRLWLNAPFVILGMWEERREVKVPLFSNYQEQPNKPFVIFRATLQV